MKYLITESQIDNVIFKYLNLKRFIPIEKGDNIYFVKSEDDAYGQIKYEKDDGYCFIYYNLVDEISRFFSLERNDSKEVIGRWVEDTLQMRVTHTSPTNSWSACELRIPSK
jgi:hypothetical protein